MSQITIDKKVTIKYGLAIVAAVIFTWVIHEFGHWLTAKVLGYDSSMTLNGTFYADAAKPTDWHKIFVSAAGPIVTILQGVVVFFLLKSKGWNKYLYPVLFIAFYMRLLAGILNVIKLNDEGRISVFFGIGIYTVPVIVSGALFYLLYKTSQKHQLSWKFQLTTTLMVMIASSILIMADQFWGIRIIG